MRTIIFCLLFPLPVSAAQVDASFIYRGQLKHGDSGFI